MTLLPSKQTLAVWMLANSPNRAGANPTVADYAADCARAKALGIDGLIVDVNGWTNLYQERIPLIYQALFLAGMSAVALADYGTFEEEHTGDLIKATSALPATLRIADGRPVFGTWGGGAAIYTALQQDLATLASEGLPVALLAGIAPLTETLAGEAGVWTRYPWIDGIMRYNQGASAANLAERITNQAAARASGKLVASGVSFYFSTAGEKEDPRTFGDGTTLTYAKTQLEALLAAKPDIAIVTTLNDWNQCTGVLGNGPAKNVNGVAAPDLSGLVTQAMPYLDAFRAGAVKPILGQQ